MAQMHGRKLFTGVENVKGFFLIDIAPVHEIEHPFRSCNHACYLHVWPGKAVVIGWWKKRHSEDSNLMLALQGRKLDETDVEEMGTAGILRSVLSGSPKETKTDEFS